MRILILLLTTTSLYAQSAQSGEWLLTTTDTGLATYLRVD
jgi:hypothetical protein